MKQKSPWIAAARLRTLPLALSGIIMGSLLAAAQGKGSWLLFALCAITATLFQIISNFANDLGDGLRGTDANRKGEARMVATGAISPRAMKRAVFILSIIGLISASILIYIALSTLPATWTYVYFLFAIAAILAAIGYTMGKRPYGYLRLGEIMVFLFFGWLAVGGTYTLMVKDWHPHILWAASAVGFLSAGVLNLNNIRDIKTDLQANKKTVANFFGFRGARIYQYILIILAIDSLFVYNWLSNSGILRNLFILGIVPLIIHMKHVSNLQKPEDADRLLRPLAISTLVISLLFGLGHL